MNKQIEFTPEELANEEWRNVNIPEYHDYYMVSNLGRVKSLDKIIIRSDGRRTPKRGIILQQVDRNAVGHLAVSLNHKGNSTIYYVHRLVALTFIPNDNPVSKVYVNHKDENPMNNRVSNLEWCTPLENSNWGTILQRKSKPVARIDPKTGNVLDTFNSIKEAATLFDIPSPSISCVCCGHNKTLYGYKWKHI